MIVREVMKTAIAIEEDISLKEVSEIMKKKKAEGLIYFKGGSMKGFVTKDSLVKYFGIDKTISQVMCKNFKSVAPDDSTEHAENLMKKYKTTYLPVVKKKKLVGIISIKDLAVGSDNEGDFVFE